MSVVSGGRWKMMEDGREEVTLLWLLYRGWNVRLGTVAQARVRGSAQCVTRHPMPVQSWNIRCPDQCMTKAGNDLKLLIVFL